MPAIAPDAADQPAGNGTLPDQALPAIARSRPPKRLHSDALFGAAAEVEIVHGAAVYRLRRTALGKLILTK